MVAEQARHEGTLTVATHDLLAVAEGYPQLRAAADYNLEVRALNRRVEAFPSSLVASAFGIRRADYFQLSDAGPAVPPTVNV